MAIVKSFQGASISKPGAYSSSTVSNSGARNLSANGTLFLIGEADEGAPGSFEGIQSFDVSELAALISKYGSGPIVDAARLALTSPSLTPGVAGADTVLVWKTNASTQASLTLNNGSSQAVLVLKDPQWGFDGNSIGVTVSDGSSGNQKEILINQGNVTETLGQNDAETQLSIQYTGSGSASSLAISGASDQAKVLSTTCTGASGDNLSINLANLSSVQALVGFLNNTGKYAAVLLNSSTGAAIPATDLDLVSLGDIKTSAEDLYRLQHELLDLVNENSKLVVASLPSTLHSGLPSDVTASLAGGAKGGSANSDFSNGLAKSLSEDYGAAVALVSQDATADILLQATDSSSTYTISSVLAALNSHLIFRGDILNRKEAQGFAGLRASTKASVYSQANTLNSYLVQLAMQDIQVLNSAGNLVWMQPHMMAALMAGIRLGTDVGEPLTHKYLNVSNVGHDVNPSTGIAAGDFDPNQDFAPAIQNGITFAEKANGGWRVVVDNTTYAQDDSFVFNRGSVVEAAQYSAKFIRSQSEAAFVGKKLANNQAIAIKTFITGLLKQLNDADIITSSSDAPQGFVEKTFTVTIQGNTALVNVEIKPVQGQDFILIQFTLGDITQSA